MKVGLTEDELWQRLGVNPYVLSRVIKEVIEQLYCTRTFSCPVHRVGSRESGWCALHAEYVLDPFPSQESE